MFVKVLCKIASSKICIESFARYVHWSSWLHLDVFFISEVSIELGKWYRPNRRFPQGLKCGGLVMEADSKIINGLNIWAGEFWHAFPSFNKDRFNHQPYYALSDQLQRWFLLLFFLLCFCCQHSNFILIASSLPRQRNVSLPPDWVDKRCFCLAMNCSVVLVIKKHIKYWYFSDCRKNRTGMCWKIFQALNR